MNPNQPTPAGILDELTHTVLAHRERLLSGYQPHDLHQLRVHIRRLRSLLKRLPMPADRSLKATWRRLFAETNAARDWDVLLETAETLLPEPSFRVFRTAVTPALEQRRERALAMLRSGEWQAHSEAWARFLVALESAEFDIPTDLLTAPLQKAHESYRRAHETGERSDWHRYRIAVKSVRYLATFLQLASVGKPGVCEMIERCKAVQDQLGAWHDCSVQLGILRSDETRQLLATRETIGEELASRISERRQQLMTRILALPPV